MNLELALAAGISGGTLFLIAALAEGLASR